MRFLIPVVLSMLAVAALAAAPLRVESLEAKHENGSEYRFPVVAGDSPAASRINTFLQASELERLPGRYRASPFEAIWPQKDSWYGTTRIDYTVVTPEPGLLSLSIVGESMGAYPTSWSRSYHFDARTGEVITLASLFTPKGAAQLGERVVQQRVRMLDDFLAGKTVDTGTETGPVRLRSDPEEAEEQKDLYRECRSRIAEVRLGSEAVTFGESSLSLGCEPCAPHALQAIDELYGFAVRLPYEELREQLDDYGRCLLLEKRADCQRSDVDLAVGVYHGTIGGRYPITLIITGVDPEDSLGAAYFYDKHAANIPLRGTHAADGSVHLDERGPPPARFDLRWVDGHLQGHWAQEGKKPLEVELR